MQYCNPDTIVFQTCYRAMSLIAEVIGGCRVLDKSGQPGGCAETCIRGAGIFFDLSLEGPQRTDSLRGDKLSGFKEHVVVLGSIRARARKTFPQHTAEKWLTIIQTK